MIPPIDGDKELILQHGWTPRLVTTQKKQRHGLIVPRIELRKTVDYADVLICIQAEEDGYAIRLSLNSSLWLAQGDIETFGPVIEAATHILARGWL